MCADTCTQTFASADVATFYTTGREAALNVATAYAPDTPVDNLLLRAGKYNAFAAFFSMLQHVVADELLRSGSIPPPVQITEKYLPDKANPVHFPVGVEYHDYGAVALLSNYGCNNTGSECANYSSACFARVSAARRAA